jgi:hypothetical protein
VQQVGVSTAKSIHRPRQIADGCFVLREERFKLLNALGFHGAMSCAGIVEVVLGCF